MTWKKIDGVIATIAKGASENQIANVAGIINMKNKKKKNQIKQVRIPLPKQRNQAFKSLKDYNRNDKWYILDS
jgi:hypothetical protein